MLKHNLKKMPQRLKPLMQMLRRPLHLLALGAVLGVLGAFAHPPAPTDRAPINPMPPQAQAKKTPAQDSTEADEAKPKNLLKRPSGLAGLKRFLGKLLRPGQDIEPPKEEPLGVLALGMGIGSLVMAWHFAGIVLGLAGIGFGVWSLMRYKKEPKIYKDRNNARAGWLLGSFGTALATTLLVLGIGTEAGIISGLLVLLAVIVGLLWVN